MNLCKSLPAFAAAAFATLLLQGCAGSVTPENQAGASAQEAFLQAFQPYCGKAFAARVIQDSAPSPAWQQQPLVVHIRDCGDHVVRMPLHVGEDRSRTWVLTLHEDYIDFQHIHLHADGSADAVSPYGGRTLDGGTATAQAFPVDETSKALFLANGLEASTANTWTLAFPQPQVLSYTLSRPGRIFEVQVNLAEPIPLPPPAWGYND